MKIILPALILALSGCASFISTLSDRHPNRKEIPVPSGATVTTLAGGAVIDGDRDGMVTVPRGAGAFRGNAGRVEVDGKMVGVVQRRVNGWIIGNWLYGGFPGLAVDFVGGAAYDPKVVLVKETTVKVQ
jgi:hypothetical protein